MSISSASTITNKMKKKIVFLILTGLFLFSCQKSDVPDEIMDYLNNMSLNKAMEETKTIVYDFENEVYEKKEKVSSTQMHLVYDKRNEEDFSKKQVETYSLNDIVYHEDIYLHVTKKVIHTYFDKEDDYYHVVTSYTGYKEDEKEEITEKYSDVTYKKEQVTELKKSIFTSQEVNSNSNQGGIYYGDFFASLTKYYRYMSIEEGIFTYKLEDYPYKSETEDGLINETIHMNSLGLLVDLYQSAKNTRTEMESILNVKVSYNQDV